MLDRSIGFKNGTVQVPTNDHLNVRCQGKTANAPLKEATQCLVLIYFISHMYKNIKMTQITIENGLGVARWHDGEVIRLNDTYKGRKGRNNLENERKKIYKNEKGNTEEGSSRIDLFERIHNWSVLRLCTRLTIETFWP